ncbi:hypothetical protein ACS0TY_002173 [Phlomoides rotata]
MSESRHGGPEAPLNREHDAVGEDSVVPSTSGSDSPRFSLVADDVKPVETRVSHDINESRDLKIENVGIRDASGGEDQSTCLLSRRQNCDLGDVKSEHTNVKTAEDYDSILSEFDQFASKGMSEAVGFGYGVGDMVWGKVKSHPWWPGHIYNEAFASPSVQRSKREGHVLVAFFGDSSYGWFDPSELVPFEDNFEEKSRQISSRAFLKAVEEAMDELSRRRSLGLVCRCRNEFNFWPSSVKGYFVVDVGDYEPVVYSTSQINKARENFHPNEMLSFLSQLALAPRAHKHWTLEFTKNKATAMACRKALFEEYDETYAEAFGTSPVGHSRPSAPVAVDPSKAPLSGRLVFAEALGKRKHSVKPTKSKDQLEKDKYLFKRRDEPTPTKTKKTGPGLSGKPLDSAKKGNMHQNSVSDINDGQLQPISHASGISDAIPSQGSMKVVEVGRKKAKLHKQRAGESSGENTTPVSKKKKKKETMAENISLAEKTKKRKKETREAITGVVKLPLADSNSGASMEKVSGMLLDVPLTTATNQLDKQKNDDLVASSSPSETKQAVDLGRLELPVLVKNLCALAVDAFHGVENSCLATTRLAVLKYRALVYQKSLVSAPPTEIETIEANSMTITDEKTTKKPLGRPDDPTKGGKKRGPSDRPESIKKKKKLGDPEEINRRKKLENVKSRKKLTDSEDVKKKKKILDESKTFPVEKKIPPRPTESPTPPKVLKVESSKRAEHPGKARNPTMLVMKFPEGASLPSGANMRAKFARFGPLDYNATRVFWKTHTCRLVFQHKVHAEDALKFARENDNIFGNITVRYYIREVGGEAVEPEPIKAQKDYTSAGAPLSKDSAVEQRASLKIGVQTHQQQQQQLKSCLKKGSGEEEGNGRGTSRVKFVLGGTGEGSSKSEQVSSSYSMMDLATSKKLPNLVPQSIVSSPLPSHHQMQKFPSNMGSIVFSSTSPQQIPDAPKNDISQQLLNLLKSCNDVVNNLKGVLGYVPYHPL